jgi:hypothetical protein
MTDINYPSRALSSATDSVTIAGTIIATNPSVSPTGAAVPASGTYVAVDVGGNLTGLTGTANGLKVDGSAVTQPVSGSVTVTQATAANLNATVTGMVAATQSGTWNVDNVYGTVSLPTGASTSAKQPALGTAGTASADIITVQGIAGATAVKVDGSASTQPISGSVTVTQATASNLNAAVVGTGSAGTAATGVITVQGIASATPVIIKGDTATGTGSASAVSIQGSAGLAVLIKGNSTAGIPSTDVVTIQGVSTGTKLPIESQGRLKAWLATYDYTGGSVTTAAYQTLLGSTANKCTQIYISDTSGSSMILAVGGVGSEVDQLYIGPGGSDAPYELAVPISSRISIKALDTTASVGRMVITALN